MTDKLKELLGKVLEWWNKFTSKQKTIIIGVASATIFAFAILLWVFSQPKYSEELRVCENTKEASEVIELLKGADIPYETSQDGLKISVLEKDLPTARLALGAAGIPSTGFGINDVTNGGFSTTESDKQKRYTVYKEDELETTIEMMDAIEYAKVKLTIPEQNGTLISTQEEASATVFIETSGDFTEENAAYLARAVATSLGNKTTNRITILSMSGALLFSGDSEMSVGGISSSQLSARQQQEAQVINSMKRVLLGTEQFNAVEAACTLDVDFSSVSSTNHEYGAPEGREEGMLVEENIYNSESTGSNGGVPGTDANETDDKTTYQYQDSANSSATESEENKKYAPNESIINKETPPGKINYANSSASATAIFYNVIREEDAKKQGLLDGITWEEYQAANSADEKITVDQEIYNLVANATGIDVSKITIIAYKKNQFIDSEGLGIGATDIISVVLILVILGLLGFVVMRSMKTDKEVETEEELSVETLLQSAPEMEIDDIGLETKSETRKMIEKFVDDNPEAAANLLRNWLNEDWG